MRQRTTALISSLTALTVSGLMLLPAGATTPAPGSAVQVASLVAASSSITTLTPTVQSELANAANDLPWKLYGTTGANGCQFDTSCIYGVKTSKKVVVLIGDSHSMMWLPAVVPWAKKNKYKVILMWERGCPIATLTTSFSFNGTADAGVFTNGQCVNWAKNSIKALVKLKPALIMLGERTTGVFSIPSNVAFTSAQWQSALQTTFSKLKPSKAKIALIEDAPWHDTEVPICLAANQTNVQACSVPFPNTEFPGYQVAEQAAATASGVTFINTNQWLCTTDELTCSSVIGTFITYRDTGHVSASYAQYLSGVMGTAMASILK